MRTALAVMLAILSACGGAEAMPSATFLSTHGLNTSPNPFSAVPDGALVIGDEVTCRESGVLTPRRGFKPSKSLPIDRCFSLPTTDQLLCTSRTLRSPYLYDPETDFAVVINRSSGLNSQLPAYPPYQNDPRVAVQGASARGTLYFTTRYGLSAVPGLALTPAMEAGSVVVGTKWRSGGLPKPFGVVYASGVSPINSMATGLRRTYRVTIGWYDELGYFYESAPSDPMPFDNTSGSNACPFVSVNVPIGVPPGGFFRVYRAKENAAGTISGDEMFLVGQVPFHGGIAVGADWFADRSALNNPVGFSDVSVDSLLTVPLYTNPLTGDGNNGAAGANVGPPAAGAIAWFKGRMYYGRTTFRQSLQLQVIGTGSGGLNTGDTITVDGVTFTAGVDFVVTNVPGQVASNIEATARDFVLKFNYTLAEPYYSAYANRPVTRGLRASYISLGGNDFGRIKIERVFPASLSDDPGMQFSVSTASPGISFPNGSTASTDNYAPGGVSWSKVNQPEAVPDINYQPVGDPTMAVLAFSIHRDVMLMWKEDGVYVVRDDGGPEPTFALLDSTAVTVAPQSVAVVDNISYALTPRGVLQVSEQGTVPVLEAVRTDLLKALNLSPNQLAQAFGVGYDAERLYILGLGPYQYVLRVPDAGYPPQPPQVTRWLKGGATSGLVIPNAVGAYSNRLVLTYKTSSPGSNLLGRPTQGLLLERKGGVASTDYVDFIGTIANPATTTTNVLAFGSDVHAEIFPGDLFLYNPGGIGGKSYLMRVTAVDNRGNVTLDASYPFTAGGTLTYYEAIRSHWRYVPITGGEPTAEKLWDSVQAHFDYIDGDWIDVLIDSNKVPGYATKVPWSRIFTDAPVSNTSGAVGTIPWLRVCRDVVLRVDPGQMEARAARLGVEVSHAQALASFRLTALSCNAAEQKAKATR